ncbi:hypothetical protein MWU76_04525 [Gelidibacter sp. F2691]|nr:hypothetical protein [Gelidibacter sp. F2691]
MTTTIEAKLGITIDSRILEIFAPLKGLEHLQVFLHGSWADSTANAFSDIDDFVIIDDTKLSADDLATIEVQLAKVQDQFYKLDPLQHHGHWRIFKSELDNYNNSYIPLFILKDAICIHGDPVISANININRTHYSLINSIKGFCNWIEKLHVLYHNDTLNIYDLKRLAGSVVLLAPLLFQLKGNNVDKRTGITNAHQLFSEEALKLIQWATALRDNWDIILDTPSYHDFVAQQKTVPLANWQKYAEEHAPVINTKKHTAIIPSNQLVNTFITEVISMLDEVSLQEKAVSDYERAYRDVEKFAIANDAIAVGQFGEIKHPGISDLDVFVCFKDDDYKDGEEKMRSFIEQNGKFTYYFTHPTICISESMLEYLPYVHTVYNLNLTYNPQNIALNSVTNPKYKNTLNILWTLFLLPGAAHELEHISKVPLRDLLLRLKNVHTSVDNINKLLGIKSNGVALSNTIRNKAFVDLKSTRAEAEEALKEAFETLTLRHGDKGSYAIIGRKLVLKEGGYATHIQNGITILSVPDIKFPILKSYLLGNADKELSTYLNAFQKMENICHRLNSPVPFVNLLRNYKNIQEPDSVKKGIYKLLSFLPFEMTLKLLQ